MGQGQEMDSGTCHTPCSPGEHPWTTSNVRKPQFPEQFVEGLTNLEMGLSECPWQQHLRLSAQKSLLKGFQSVLIPTNGISFTFIRLCEHDSQGGLCGAT